MTKRESVSKLTSAPEERHKPDGRRRVSGSFRAPMPALLLSFLVGPAFAGGWHDPADIASTAENYLRTRIDAVADDGGNETVLSSDMLDKRLKLAACDRPLSGFLRPGARIAARTIVGVRCSGSRPWKVYVPVEMTVNMDIWVASRPLPRGHILSEEDMVAERRNVSRQAGGYFSTGQALAGQRLEISILQGRAFEPRFVEADNVIRRGQSVTLAVRSNGIDVRMSGTALSDGALNQRIRIENRNSGRVVEGIVRSRELVEVLVPAPALFSESGTKVSATAADTGIGNND